MGSSSMALMRAIGSGVSVSSAGDINNDGYDDIIIGALGADPNGDISGESYVVFGKATGLLSISRTVCTRTEPMGSSSTALMRIIIVVIPCPLLGTSTTMDTTTSSSGHPRQTLMASGESYVVFGQSEFDAFVELDDLALMV